MPVFFAYAADILMILASLGAAIYCLILSRRLSRLTSFDQGIGGAIAVLSAQVDDMQTALAQAKAGSDSAGQDLRDLVHQARDVSGELELMIAACHDFAEEALVVQGDHRAPPPPTEGDARSKSGVSDPAAPMPERGPVPQASTQTRASEEWDDHDPAPSPDPAATTDPSVVTPVFGSRRSVATQPMFRHRGNGGG